MFPRVYYFGLYEQFLAWPLPQRRPHSAQTHCGSGACDENTGSGVLIINPENTIPDNTNSAISIE
jgi:hypothetical protein